MSKYSQRLRTLWKFIVAKEIFETNLSKKRNISRYEIISSNLFELIFPYNDRCTRDHLSDP